MNPTKGYYDSDHAIEDYYLRLLHNKLKDIYVYNFDVGEDHTYTVSNISTHNCHMLYQFRVYGDKLCCSMYQRSGDMGLGVPFNIASATIMTYIFAYLTGKKPWKFIHTIGDAHIYLNHMEAKINYF